MKFHHALFALSAVLSAVSANATGAKNEPDALEKMHDYAICLVTKRPNIVRDTLKLDFQTQEYKKQIDDLGTAKSSCVQRGRMRMATVLFAGSLAEALFELDYRGKQAAAILPADWTANPIAARSETEMVALCMVQKHPTEIQAIFSTKPASDTEKAAFVPLIADMPSCVSSGSTLQFNRPLLRSIFALGMYRAARHFGGAADA